MRANTNTYIEIEEINLKIKKEKFVQDYKVYFRKLWGFLIKSSQQPFKGEVDPK